MEMEEARKRELADELASRLERWGLATPAAFFLEWNRPLSFIGSQLLLLCQPFLSPFVSHSVVGEVAALLDDRDGIDLLLDGLTRRRHLQARDGPSDQAPSEAIAPGGLHGSPR